MNGEAPASQRPPAGVIFDVDGTLYRQNGLRRRMLRDLLLSAMVSARTRMDIRILKRFRTDRETLGQRVQAGFEKAQYSGTAETLGIPPDRVKEAVNRWIHQRPLRYLRHYRRPGIEPWLTELRDAGVLLGVYSEYPATEKLAALGLSFDTTVASTDPEVDAFKPDPKGIQVILDRWGVSPDRALYVGDRTDRDLPCAQAAGVAFLLVGENQPAATPNFPPAPELLPAFLKGE